MLFCIAPASKFQTINIGISFLPGDDKHMPIFQRNAGVSSLFTFWLEHAIDFPFLRLSMLHGLIVPLSLGMLLSLKNRSAMRWPGVTAPVMLGLSSPQLLSLLAITLCLLGDWSSMIASMVFSSNPGLGSICNASVLSLYLINDLGVVHCLSTASKDEHSERGHSDVGRGDSMIVRRVSCSNPAVRAGSGMRVLSDVRGTFWSGRFFFGLTLEEPRRRFNFPKFRVVSPRPLRSIALLGRAVSLIGDKLGGPSPSV